MKFSRQSAAAALLAACVAATGADTAFAAGQAAAPNADAGADRRGGPNADASGAAASGAAAPGAQGHGPERGRGPDDGPREGFGGSRPGAPGLDGPSPHEAPPHAPHGAPGFGGPGGPGGFGLLGQLHRLDLSEAQQDKLFAITYAAAPQQRSQEKAERKAHATLRALGASPQFDEAKANAAARELGQAIAGGVLLRARLESQVLAVLTPAQREQLRKDRPPVPPAP